MTFGLINRVAPHEHQSADLSARRFLHIFDTLIFFGEIMNKQFELTRNTIAGLIQGSLDVYEWDDNMSVKCTDPQAEALRRIAWQVRDLFPPNDRKEFCSSEGLGFLKLLLTATEQR
jgi:hypothetical protein